MEEIKRMPLLGEKFPELDVQTTHGRRETAIHTLLHRLKKRDMYRLLQFFLRLRIMKKSMQRGCLSSLKVGKLKLL